MNRLLFAFLLMLSLISCTEVTIERQVEKCLKTQDSYERRQLAYSIADSLDPSAIDLINGLKPNPNAQEALNYMVERLAPMLNGETSKHQVITCLSKINNENSAIALGEAFIKSEESEFAYQSLLGLQPEFVSKGLLKILSYDLSERTSATYEYFQSSAKDPYQLIVSNSDKVNSFFVEDAVKKLLIKYETEIDKKYFLITDMLKRKNLSPEFRAFLNKQLSAMGSEYVYRLVGEYYRSKSTETLEIIKDHKVEVAEMLMENFNPYFDKEDLLVQLGDPAVKELILKMKDRNQEIRFAAADVLVKMYKNDPNSVGQLTSAFDTQSIGAIAQNYPFYIRMGLKGTEDLLLKALDKRFTQDMCLDYINCGNYYIEAEANNIAEKHGYHVFTEMGSHYGPKWGSGN